ncbi:MAG: ATPase [Bacteroidetes bacterium CG2_30_33_31]|nr:MAG: ATPase [Bacteroidetes bacterium CG2_30_33_31]
MNNAIIIQSLSKSYGDVEALKNISIDIKTGEIFGFIGSDGAGKTTLFRILTSLMIPDHGTAEVIGFDVVKDYKELRKNLGYMPGQFSLYQDLTVKENLNFFAGIFKTSIAENYHLIEDIYKQIEPFKNRRAGKLSGGMKQKLALSCALIHKPKVLFLDEPTTGVDVVSRAEFWEILKSLKQQGITIVVSTPYMDEAALCDRVALIQKGAILTIDTPENIVSNFHEPIYAVKAENRHKLFEDISKFEATKSAYWFGENMHWIPKENFDEKSLENYFNMLNYNNIYIQKISASIEDVFMELMIK